MQLTTWYISFGVQYYRQQKHPILGRYVDHITFKTSEVHFFKSREIAWLMTGGLFSSLYSEQNKYMKEIETIEGFEVITDFIAFRKKARAILYERIARMKADVMQYELCKEDDEANYYRAGLDDIHEEYERALKWLASHDRLLFGMENDECPRAVSYCCGVGPENDEGICPKCKEHTEFGIIEEEV